MNKSDLARQVSESTGVSLKVASDVLSGVLNEITSALSSGESVSLVGFGQFETRKRAARKGRNLQTGAEIEIPEATVPVFKAGKALKEAVNIK